MIEGTIVYATVITLITIMAVFGVVMEFKYRRAVVVLAFLLVLPVTFVMNIDLLSRARPIELMLPWMRPDPETAQILSVYYVPDERIYLVLMWDGLDYPRSYSWPWTDKGAEKLQGATRRMAETGAEGMIVDRPFDPSRDDDDLPDVREYVSPRTPREKTVDPSETIILERPDSE